MHETTQHLLNWLHTYGIELDGAHKLDQAIFGAQADATLIRRGAAQKYLLTYLPSMTLTHLSPLNPRDRSMHPMLVLGDHIGERSSAAFREAGIQYLDAGGNAYLYFGDVLIDVRGRRDRRRTKSYTPETETNLFSARRSQVIFALLVWPGLTDGPLRELSRVAGVSVGLAQSTMKLLDKTGFLQDASVRRLRHTVDLLDHWTAAYPTGLLPTLQIRDFSGDIDDIRSIEGDDSLYVSGEAAARDLLRPVTLTLYTNDLNPRLPAINRWRTDGRPNISIRRKFWTDPYVHSGRKNPDKIKPVPSLLIYADLIATGDSRQREAALRLREDHLGYIAN